ncbi:MAG: hypothetical protein AB2812_13065, partial [Candidatus Sedimenticola endophacoides]
MSGCRHIHREIRKLPTIDGYSKHLLADGVDGGQKPRIFGEYPVPSGAAPAKTKGGPP